MKLIRLNYFIFNSNLQCLQYLIGIDKGVSIDPKLLYNVSMTSSIDMVKYLISLDAGFIIDDIIDQIASTGMLPQTRLLCEAYGHIENAITVAAFIGAVEFGHLEVVKYLVEEYPSKCEILDVVSSGLIKDKKVLRYLESCALNSVELKQVLLSNDF